MAHSTHRCPAGDCTAHIPGEQLMCPTHWRLVPSSLKRALHQAWRGGAGADSREHEHARRACVEAAHASSQTAADRQLRRTIHRFLARHRHPNHVNGETWDDEDVSRVIRATRCHPHKPDPRTRRCRLCGAVMTG